MWGGLDPVEPFTEVGGRQKWSLQFNFLPHTIGGSTFLQQLFEDFFSWGREHLGQRQNPIHIRRVGYPYFESDIKIFQFCSTILLKRCDMSILAFHEYYIN